MFLSTGVRGFEADEWPWPNHTSKHHWAAVRKDEHIETFIWRFPKMWGTPKSSILVGFFIIIHLFCRNPIPGNPHINGGPNQPILHHPVRPHWCHTDTAAVCIKMLGQFVCRLGRHIGFHSTRPAGISLKKLLMKRWVDSVLVSIMSWHSWFEEVATSRFIMLRWSWYSIPTQWWQPTLINGWMFFGPHQSTRSPQCGPPSCKLVYKPHEL